MSCQGLFLDLPEEEVVGGVVPPDHVAVGAAREVLVAVAAGDHQQLRSRRGRRGACGRGQRDDCKHWNLKVAEFHTKAEYGSNRRMVLSPEAFVPHAETTAAAIVSGVDVGCRGAEAESTDEDGEVAAVRADTGNLDISKTVSCLMNSLLCSSVLTLDERTSC